MKTIQRHIAFRTHNGLSLVELLIGMAIGLLITAVALGSMLISQSISTTTSESTALQQDASNALRIIGLQIRQAGSVALNLQPDISAPMETEALRPVIFEHLLGIPTDPSSPINPVASPLVVKSTGDSIQINYENFTEYLHRKSSGASNNGNASQLKDCLGQNQSNHSLSKTISSTFFLRDSQLMCTGVAGTPQPVISNVKNFSVRLLLSPSTGTTSQSQYATPQSFRSGVFDWKDARAVEICLELESPNLRVTDIGMQYQKCNGQRQAQRDRLIVVARQIFNIRSHGAWNG